LPTSALARKYGVHRHTIRKWRHRDSVEGASHQPHEIHATLTKEQEVIVVALPAGTWRPVPVNREPHRANRGGDLHRPPAAASTRK
jgi:hypothetical protein